MRFGGVQGGSSKASGVASGHRFCARGRRPGAIDRDRLRDLVARGLPDTWAGRRFRSVTYQTTPPGVPAPPCASAGSPGPDLRHVRTDLLHLDRGDTTERWRRGRAAPGRRLMMSATGACIEAARTSTSSTHRPLRRRPSRRRNQRPSRRQSRHPNPRRSRPRRPSPQRRRPRNRPRRPAPDRRRHRRSQPVARSDPESVADTRRRAGRDHPDARSHRRRPRRAGNAGRRSSWARREPGDDRVRAACCRLRRCSGAGPGRRHPGPARAVDRPRRARDELPPDVVVVITFGLTSSLFNSTIKSNRDDIDALWRRRSADAAGHRGGRGPRRRRSRPWPAVRADRSAIALILGVTGVVYGFLYQTSGSMPRASSVRVDRRRRRVRDVPHRGWRRRCSLSAAAVRRRRSGCTLRQSSSRSCASAFEAHGLPAGHPVRLRRVERHPRHRRARSAPVGDARDRAGRRAAGGQPPCLGAHPGRPAGRPGPTGRGGSSSRRRRS